MSIMWRRLFLNPFQRRDLTQGFSTSPTSFGEGVYCSNAPHPSLPYPNLPYPSLPHPHRLAGNLPVPLSSGSTSTLRGISTGSTTQVRILDSRRRLRSLFNPNQSGVTSLGHPFTREMITTLTCGYCNSRLNSINDLRYHLSNVRYHSVFSCCGRFFKRQIDLDRHREAKFIHNHEVIRNA